MRRKFFAIAALLLIAITVFPISAIAQQSRSTEIEDEHKDDEATSPANVNLDMKMVYGQYNSMLSTINLSQESGDFVYLLNSNFKRSNDFGYADEMYQNSSFYEHAIGFVGNLNVSDNWKTVFDLELNNDSRGMFDNSVFSREEKEKARFSLKNVIKTSRTFELSLVAGGAQYVHRLRPTSTGEPENSRVNQINVAVNGEYIWSTTNGIKFKTHYYYYDFQEEGIENDQFASGEVVDDFHLTKHIGITVGGGVNFNRDDRALISPIVGMSIKDFRHMSIVLQYRYDLLPFRPEVYYLQQKYIYPNYSLPPGRVHRGDMKCEFRVNEIIHLLAQFIIERNNNFYNYFPLPGNVLSAHPIEAIVYRSKFDVTITLFNRLVEYDLLYEFARYQADEWITYSPVHTFTSSIRYNGKRWTFDWNNRYISQVYTNPYTDDQLRAVIVGDFGIQRKMLESFYAYLKVENLYNYKYYLREGYPEQGITFLGGIRILM
ncbi:MAG: hypothetical protein N2316_08370 [Spirochaetes bacterium]|nr:hypothetical protein [Spirochaetota bacterium]